MGRGNPAGSKGWEKNLRRSHENKDLLGVLEMGGGDREVTWSELKFQKLRVAGGCGGWEESGLEAGGKLLPPTPVRITKEGLGAGVAVPMELRCRRSQGWKMSGRYVSRAEG